MAEGHVCMQHGVGLPRFSMGLPGLQALLSSTPLEQSVHHSISFIWLLTYHALTACRAHRFMLRPLPMELPLFSLASSRPLHPFKIVKSLLESTSCLKALLRHLH